MDDEDSFTTLDFNISLKCASVATPILPHEGDLLKGICMAYGVPALGEFAYTRFDLNLEVGQLVRVQATVLVLKADVSQVESALKRLQDEGKIVSLVYGG